MASAPPIIDLTGGGQADGFSIPPNPFAARPRTGNGAISGIVFHHTGPGSLAGVMTGAQTYYLSNGKKNPGYGTGAQYYIDTDGTIYQYAPDSSRAYNIESPGSKNRDDALAATAKLANSNVIGIEIVAPDSQNLTAAQKASAVSLGTYLASKYSVDPSMIVGHGELQSNRQTTEGVGVALATREALAGSGAPISGYPGDLSTGGSSMGSLYAMPAPLNPPTSEAIALLRAQAAARQASIASVGAAAGVVIEGQASGPPPKAPLMTPKLDLGVVDPDMMGMGAPPNAVLGAGGAFGGSDVALGGFGSVALSGSGAASPLTTIGAPAGLVAAGNLDLNQRKVFNAPDGTYRTENSISIGTDAGEVLIPTVVNGKQLSESDAIKHYQDTGENLGTFSTPAAADAYAQALHERQAHTYSPAGLDGPVEATKTDRQRTDLANSPATLDELVRQVYSGTGLPPQGSQPEPEFPGPPQRWMIATTPIAANANVRLVAPVLTPSVAFAPPDSLAQTLSGTPYASMGMAFDHFTVPAAVAHTVTPPTATLQKPPAAPAPSAATVKPQPVFPGDLSLGGGGSKAPAVKSVSSGGDNRGMQPGGAPNYDPIGPGPNFSDLQKMVDASKASAGVMTVSSVPSAKPATTSISIVNPEYVKWEAAKAAAGGVYPGDLSQGGVQAATPYPGDLSQGGVKAAVTATPPPPKYISKQVPTSAPRSSTPLSAGGYRVQSGDTLSAIAARSGVSVAALVAANGLANPDQIQAGGNLVIPGKAANSNAIPMSPSSTKNQASAKAAQNAGNGGGSNSGAVTFQGSSTKTNYTAGQTYSNKAGTYVANSNGTFTKVG